uniref:LigA n=1 Tax=Parastrongyloides trichosuri TaxID=131310 RepID=A0A0N4ZGU5_PARTI
MVQIFALEFLPARSRIALARLGQLLAPGQHHEGLVAADLVLADHRGDGAQRHARARVVEEAGKLGHAHAIAVGIDRQFRQGDDVQALIDRHPHVGNPDHAAQLVQRQGAGAHLEDGVRFAALAHDGVARFRQGGADGAQRIAGVLGLEIGLVDEDARALRDRQGQALDRAGQAQAARADPQADLADDSSDGCDDRRLRHRQIAQLARQQSESETGVADDAEPHGDEADQAGAGHAFMGSDGGGHGVSSSKGSCLYDKQARHPYACRQATFTYRLAALSSHRNDALANGAAPPTYAGAEKDLQGLAQVAAEDGPARRRSDGSARLHVRPAGTERRRQVDPDQHHRRGRARRPLGPGPVGQGQRLCPRPVRRHEAAPDGGQGPGAQSAGADPGRTDSGRGRRAAPPAVGLCPQDQRGGGDGDPDHPLPRRGAGAVRHHRHHQPRRGRGLRADASVAEAAGHPQRRGHARDGARDPARPERLRRRPARQRGLRRHLSHGRIQRRTGAGGRPRSGRDHQGHRHRGSGSGRRLPGHDLRRHEPPRPDAGLKERA